MRIAPALPLFGIDVVILAGGFGTRLRGVVDAVPKPLAPVLGRPFLFYLLDMLSLRGARSVTLCSGYMADFIQQKNGSEWTRSPLTKLRLSTRKPFQQREARCHCKSTGTTHAGEHW